MAEKNGKVAGRVVLGFGILIGVWAVAAFAGGLSQAGSLPELARQYMIAIGNIAPLHTLIDYCTRIKGVEYFICVTFFVALPVVYLFINKEKMAVHIKR
jgi:hypothetical protein